MLKKLIMLQKLLQLKIKNVTNAALDARHKDLVQKTTFKSELKKVDDKASANNSKVLSYEHKLKQKGKNYFDGDGTQNYKYFEDC